MSDAKFTSNIFLRILLTVPLRFKGIILVPFLTALFPKELYGVWIQIILLRDLLTGLTTIRLDMALVRYMEGTRDAGRIFMLVLYVTLVCGLLLLGLLSIFDKPISRIAFGSEQYHGLIMLLGLWICVSACLQVALAVFRAQMRIVTLSVREFLSALWLILCAVIAWHFSLGIETLLLICIAGDTVILIWVLQQVRSTLSISFSLSNWELLKRYFKYSLPLVVSFFFSWLVHSVDRFCIVKMLGLEHLGMYGIAFYISNVVVCLLNPVNYVLFPKISREWERGKIADAFVCFSKAYGLIALMGIPAIVGICALYKNVVILLAGPQYLASWHLVLFLSLSVVLDRLCVTSTYVYHLLNKTYILPLIRAMTSMFSLTLCWLLTTRLGLLGAGMSRFLTFLFVLSFLVLWLRRKVPLHVPVKTILKAAGASMAMGVVVFLCPKETGPEVVFAVIAGALVYFVLLFLLSVLTLGGLSDNLQSILGGYSRSQRVGASPKPFPGWWGRGGPLR
jgi:O-antigen/teichoic acid export membrane protein